MTTTVLEARRGTPVLNALVDNRSDPSVRRTLDDYYFDRGCTPARLGVVLQIDAAAAADAADAAIQLTRRLTKLLREEPDMKEGLKVVTIPGSYGYNLARVGWLKRITADEYELHGARTIIREGAWSPEGLNQLAAEGPTKKYRLGKPDKLPEEVHRLTMRRCLPCDETAWEKECPRPKDWPAASEAA